MHRQEYFTGATIIAVFIALIGCTGNKNTAEDQPARFTKADSVAETYLELQDSMLNSWNRMINDDNHKIKAMKNLLHELTIAGKYDPEQVNSLEQRLEQLSRIRYTPRTMSNSDVVEEYDFASNSIVSELISMTESHPAFAYNETMQALVEKIRSADQRVTIYRDEYDRVAHRFNNFLERNKEYLGEIEVDTAQKKPLFQMVSGE